MSTDMEPYMVQIEAAWTPHAEAFIRAAGIGGPPPSPECERWRHIWGRAVGTGYPDIQVRFCLRCAKRGAYVALTEAVSEWAGEGA